MAAAYTGPCDLEDMFCEKCGQLMLESDYDFYCDRDEILLRKKEAPLPPTFGEGESIVKMLAANDTDPRRISLLNKGVFSEIVLTNRRIMLLRGGNLELEIPLANVLEALPNLVKGELSIHLLPGFADGPLLFSLADESEAREWLDAITTAEYADMQTVVQTYRVPTDPKKEWALIEAAVALGKLRAETGRLSAQELKLYEELSNRLAVSEAEARTLVGQLINNGILKKGAARREEPRESE